MAVEELRAYSNDVFRVDSSSGWFVLKVYGKGWRSEPEVRYEVGPLEYLASKGISVATAVPGRDGQPVQLAGDYLEHRIAVLFSWAPGVKPSSPLSDELYELVGRAAAAMHEASDDYVRAYARQPLDFAYLLDSPLELVLTHLSDREARRTFRVFVAQLRQAIQERAERGLNWGPCHGDLTLDDFHITCDNQVVWYDFASGGTGWPGWHACNPPGWTALVPDARSKREAFIRGYQHVRELRSNDVEAAPYHAAASGIWGIEVDLRRRVLPLRSPAVHEYLLNSLNGLRPWVIRFSFS